FKSTPPRITAQTRGSHPFQGVRSAFIRTLVCRYLSYIRGRDGVMASPSIRPSALKGPTARQRMPRVPYSRPQARRACLRRVVAIVDVIAASLLQLRSHDVMSPD